MERGRRRDGEKEHRGEYTSTVINVLLKRYVAATPLASLNTTCMSDSHRVFTLREIPHTLRNQGG